MAIQTLTIKKLSPIIGAEIHGVDLSQPLDDDTFQVIHDAWMEHQVIFFRDQHLTVEQHKAFGRRFGELHLHPAAPRLVAGHPEILVIHADEHSTRVAGHGWHSDVSCDPEPPMGSILYLHEVPEAGGDTMFASMYAAYDALSDHMKQFLAGLTAVHASDHVYRGRYGVADDQKQFPTAEHPIIRTHPVTGRQGLFVNAGFTTHIKGLPPKESRAVLDFLFEHIRTPEFHCRFKWENNSIACWDNRCVQHHALWDYYPQVRHGHRVTIKGDRPFHRS